MKMPARLLLRRAAGMKNRRPFVRRERSKFQFLECARRHEWNLRPMFDNFRPQLSCFTNFSIGEIVFELQRKQFQRKFVEFRVLRLPRYSEAKAGGKI